MTEMTILVCLKQIPDPEAPSSVFRIDQDAKRVVPAGVPPVINPYDENALEAALAVKDQYGAHIIGISLGEKLAQPVLRKALAAGADELILIEDPLFGEINSYSTALVLSKAIQKMQKPITWSISSRLRLTRRGFLEHFFFHHDIEEKCIRYAQAGKAWTRGDSARKRGLERSACLSEHAGYTLLD